MTFLPRLGPQVGAAESGATAGHPERYEGHPARTTGAGSGTASAAARLGTASAADEPSFDFAGLGARAGKDTGEEAGEDVTSDEPGTPLHGEAGGQLALRVTGGSSGGAVNRGERSFAAELARNVTTVTRATDEPSAATATGPQPGAQAAPARAEALPAGSRSIALRSPEPTREGDEPGVIAVAASSTLAGASWAAEASRPFGVSGSLAASSPVTPSARPARTASPSRPPLDSDGGGVLAFQMISRADEPPSQMSERFEVRGVMADSLAQAEVVDHPAADTMALGEGTSKSAVSVTLSPAPASPESRGHIPSRAAPRGAMPAQELLPSRGAEQVAPVVNAPSSRAGLEPRTPVVAAGPERSGASPIVVEQGGSPSVRAVAPASVTVGESLERRAPRPPVAFVRAGAVYARAAFDASAAVATPSPPPSLARSPSPLAQRPGSRAARSVAVGGPIDGAKAAPEFPAVARSAQAPADSPVARGGVAARHAALTSLATSPDGSGRAVPASRAAVQTPTSSLAAPEHDIRRSLPTAAAAPFLPRLGAEPRSFVPSGEVGPAGAVALAVSGGPPVHAVADRTWPESERGETGTARTDSRNRSEAPPVRPANEPNPHAGEPSQASQPDRGHAQVVAGELAVAAPPATSPSPRANWARSPVAGGEVAAPQTFPLTGADPLGHLPAPASEPPLVAQHLVSGQLAAPAFRSAPDASPAAVETPTAALAAPEHDPLRSQVTVAAVPSLARPAAKPPSSEARPPGAVPLALPAGLPVAAVADGPSLKSNRAETGAAGTDVSRPTDARPARPETERTRSTGEPSRSSRLDGGRAQLVLGGVSVTAPSVATPNPRADRSPPPVAGGDVVAPLTSALIDAEPLAPPPAISSPVPPRVDVALELGATPQRSAGFSTSARADVASRADVSQRWSAQPAPPAFEPAASPVSKVGAEPPLVAPRVSSGAFASAPHATRHAPGAGAVAEATAAHPTPLVVSSSATPPTSRLSDTRRVRAAHLDLAQQSSRSGTVATSPSTEVVGTPAAADKGEFAISGGRPTAVDSVVPRAVGGLGDRVAARSNPEPTPAREERPSTPGARPARAAQSGATANAFVPTSAATLPAFAPAFASATPSAGEPKVTGGASARDAGASREVQAARAAKSATRTSTIADVAEGGPSSGSPSARADEPRTERREATPIGVSPPAPAQTHAVAPSGHSAPGALSAPVTIPPGLLPPTAAPARPLYDMATSDQSLQATALGRNAHVHLDTGAAGALSLHLTVRDGVADLEIDGPAVEALDLRPEDIRRALAGEGLALGHFASRVNEAAEAPAGRAPTSDASASAAAPEAQRPRASDAAPSLPAAAFTSHQSGAGASSYGEGRKHWHDDGADAGSRDGRSPAPGGSSQSSSTSPSGDDGPRRRRGFHVTA